MVRIKNTKISSTELLNLATTDLIEDIYLESLGLDPHQFTHEEEIITFSNLEFINSLRIKHISKSAVFRKLKFINVKFNTLWIESSNLKGIDIAGGSEINFIYIVDSGFSNGLNIDSSSIVNELKINHSNLTTLNVDKAILQIIYIYNKSKIESFDITSTTINDEFYVHESEINQTLSIKDCQIKSFTLGDITFNDEIQIDYSSIHELYWLSKTPIHFFANNCEVNYFNFFQSIIPKDTTIQINNCFSHFIRFDSTSNFGNIYFNNINLINGKPKIGELDGDSQIQFINSEMGKSSFIGCDLSTFTKFNFYNSKITELFIADTIFPNQIGSPVGITNKGRILEQQRLAYGQFKKVYEGQGDAVNALVCKSKELEIYRKKLIEEKSKENRAERFNLWMHKATTNYGTDWWVGFKLVFWISIFCYCLYCFSLGNYPTIQPKEENWDLFLENLSHYPEFFNPLHRADSLEEKLNKHETINGMLTFGRFMNYLSRLIITFLAYQTIQAFRKHGRNTVN